jgi:hypothetical protein
MGSTTAVVEKLGVVGLLLLAEVWNFLATSKVRVGLRYSQQLSYNHITFFYI